MIVTSYGRPGYLKRAVAVGVRGFLPKTVSAAVLAEVTVRNHLSSAVGNLGAENRHEAVQIARRHGWI